MCKKRRGGLTRLVDSLCDEVIDENTDKPVRAAQHKLLPLQRQPSGVDTGEDALRGRLFVTRRAVDLASQKEARDPLRLERVCFVGTGKAVSVCLLDSI